MLTTEVTDGGLPGYYGQVDRQEMAFGPVVLQVMTWPQYRIGGSTWPSGRLLAHALATGALGDLIRPIPGCFAAELGAGPGLPALVCAKLGAARVVLTDVEELVPLMQANIELNGLEACCGAQTLDWTAAVGSNLAAARRRGNAGVDGPLDLLVAADVVYFEEQDPLLGALLALMEPGHTQLVLAYRNRTPADRSYLEEKILPRLETPQRRDFALEPDGMTEIYVGRLPAAA